MKDWGAKGWGRPMLYTIPEILAVRAYHAERGCHGDALRQLVMMYFRRQGLGRAHQKAWTYFISGADLIKIGTSDRPVDRMKDLQAGSPVPLTLTAVTTSPELFFHGFLAEFWAFGEWFHPNHILDRIILHLDNHLEMPELDSWEQVFAA